MTHKIGRGGTLTLDARFLDGDMRLVDADPVRIAITDPDDVVVASGVSPTTHIATGIYDYAHAAAADAKLGVWSIEWTGVVNGVPVGPLGESFEVVAAGSISFGSPWPNADELAVFCNKTFDDQARASAEQLLINLRGKAKSEARQTIEQVSDDAVELKGTWDIDLELPERPVLAVSSVAFAGRRIGQAPLPVTGFRFTRQGSLYRGTQLIWPEGAGGPAANPEDPWPFGADTLHWGGPTTTVLVTYSHGYAEIPDDIRGVILDAGKRAIANPEAVEGERERIGEYEHEVTYARRMDATRTLVEFTDAELRVLHAYRKETW